MKIKTVLWCKLSKAGSWPSLKLIFTAHHPPKVKLEFVFTQIFTHYVLIYSHTEIFDWQKEKKCVYLGVCDSWRQSSLFEAIEQLNAVLQPFLVWQKGDKNGKLHLLNKSQQNLRADFKTTNIFYWMVMSFFLLLRYNLMMCKHKPGSCYYQPWYILAYSLWQN